LQAEKRLFPRLLKVKFKCQFAENHIRHTSVAIRELVVIG